MSSKYYKDIYDSFKRMKDKSDGTNYEIAHGIIDNLQDYLDRCTWQSVDSGVYGGGTHTYTNGSGVKQTISIYNNANDLQDDLDNLDENNTNEDIARCIIHRTKECIENSKLVIQTSGTATPNGTYSSVSVINYPSTNCTITVTNDTLEHLNLSNDFYSTKEKENEDLDKRIAQDITDSVKSMINSLSFIANYTGTLIGSSTSGKCISS